MDLEPGQPVGLEEHEELWRSMSFDPEEIIEVPLDFSSLYTPSDVFAGFLIEDVKQVNDGSLILIVRLLGCSDADAKRELGSSLIRGGYQVHVCGELPCALEVTDQPDMIHIRKMQKMSVEAFLDAPYLNGTEVKEAKKHIKNLANARAKLSKAASAKSAARGKLPGGADPPSSKGGGGLPSAPKMTPEMKAALKEKLQKVRGTAHPTRPGSASLLGGGSLRDPSPSPSILGDAPEVVAPQLNSGATFPPAPPGLTSVAPLGVKVKRPREPKEADKLEALKDGITGDLKSQLMIRALQSAQEKDQKKVKKSKKSKSAQVIGALTDILLKSKTKKKEKKEKKEKAKRRRRILPDGTIESSSDDSSTASSILEIEDSGSDQDLEPPIKKKARDRPGSVLSLLTDHVQETLEQGATLAMDRGGASLTSGVKVMTYFFLHLRPSFPNALKELRELHHLAGCIDALRAGDLALTGDALAGRFIAIHQSLLDAGWGTAKHMELFPLEDTTAASNSLVLATRKHQKLVQKAQGYPSGNWSGQGRGKGKNSWYQGGASKGENPKGDKGKGKGGRGKGNKSGNTWGNQNNEWRDKKEKPEDKNS